MQEYYGTECEVDAEEIQGLVFRLNEFMKPYLPMFGRSEPQGHGLTYVMGRMEPLDRRTIEPIANRHDIEHRPLQRIRPVNSTLAAAAHDDYVPLQEVQQWNEHEKRQTRI